jgi:uncharacterized protein YgbK (DUF1537 family)
VGIAVADASDIERIRAIVQAWSDAEPVLLAGSSAVIGATTSDGHDRRRLPQIEGPILIACGSVHPAARAQLAFAEHHGVIVTYLADDVTARALASADAIALATEIPVGDVDEPLAVAAATLLARGVAELAAKVSLGALVVIGGDTAAAVIGDAATSVHGSIAPGTPWMTVDGFDVPVVTRSGGFGSDHALVDLLRSMRQ